MVKKQTLVAAAGALLIILVWWWFTRPTPERRIHRKLDSLAKVISKQEKEPNSQMLLKMQQLEFLMADPVEIGTDRHGMRGTHTGAELVSLATRVRGMMTRIDLDFHDVNIETLTETTATVRCTTRFLMVTGEHGVEETAETRIQLRKIDGVWRFTDFLEIEVMSK